MLASAVPPCRTITFDGGQFVGALDGPGVVAPASEVAVLDETGLDEFWSADAGALVQLDARTFFLCLLRFFDVGGF